MFKSTDSRARLSGLEAQLHHLLAVGREQVTSLFVCHFPEDMDSTCPVRSLWGLSELIDYIKCWKQCLALSTGWVLFLPVFEQSPSSCFQLHCCFLHQPRSNADFSYIHTTADSSVHRAHVGQYCLQRALPSALAVCILLQSPCFIEPPSHCQELGSKRIPSSRADDFVVQKTVYKITHRFTCNTKLFHHIEGHLCMEELWLKSRCYLIQGGMNQSFSIPHIFSKISDVSDASMNFLSSVLPVPGSLGQGDNYRKKEPGTHRIA